MRIAQHTFVITGAASGLGKATALCLAKRQANIVIADINHEAGNSIAQELQTQGLYIALDVTQEEVVTQGLNNAKQHFGSLHGLINCAGILIAQRIVSKTGHLFEIPRFKACINVNLLGSFNLLRLMTPILQQNPTNSDGERGVIINTSSIAAYEGQIGQTAYSASKAGIMGMTLPAARELSAFGIRVMSIAPGVFATPLFNELDRNKQQALAEQMPFPKRLGKAEEYAQLVAHIIENPMLNGSTIRLDGGMRLQY